MIQRPKKYHNPSSPDDRIPLDANNNKAISQSILVIKLTKITFRVTRKQKKKKLQLNKQISAENLHYTSGAQRANWHWIKSVWSIQYCFNLVLIKLRKIVNF